MKQHDKKAFIEDVAAQEVVKADKRPWHITPYAQIRRTHTATSDTNAVARAMMDAHEAFSGMEGYGEMPGRHLTELVDDFSPEEVRATKARAFEAAQQQAAGGNTQASGGGNVQAGGGQQAGSNGGNE
jgi:hypothetical protein